jgi:Domain of unknown function (DUF4288)
MAWFTAVLLRGEEVDGEPGPARRGDVLYKLVEASDAESAYARALEIGEETTESYTDSDGTSGKFRFLGLAELVELLGPPGDGTEVYSRFVSTPPEPMLRDKEDLAVFAPKYVDDKDVWADGEGAVDTSEDPEAEDDPDEDADLVEIGDAPLKPR